MALYERVATCSKLAPSLVWAFALHRPHKDCECQQSRLLSAVVLRQVMQSSPRTLDVHRLQTDLPWCTSMKQVRASTGVCLGHKCRARNELCVSDHCTAMTTHCAFCSDAMHYRLDLFVLLPRGRTSNKYQPRQACHDPGAITGSASDSTALCGCFVVMLGHCLPRARRRRRRPPLRCAYCWDTVRRARADGAAALHCAVCDVRTLPAAHAATALPPSTALCVLFGYCLPRAPSTIFRHGEEDAFVAAPPVHSSGAIMEHQCHSSYTASCCAIRNGQLCSSCATLYGRCYADCSLLQRPCFTYW